MVGVCAIATSSRDADADAGAGADVATAEPGGLTESRLRAAVNGSR